MKKIGLLLLLLSFLDAQISLQIPKKQYWREGAPFLLSLSVTSPHNAKGKLLFYQRNSLFYATDELVLTQNKNNSISLLMPSAPNALFDIFWEGAKKIHLGKFEVAQKTKYLVLSTQANVNFISDSIVSILVPGDYQIQHFSRLLQHPLAYCAADVVIVHSGAVVNMRKEDYAALANWIKMGGQRLFCCCGYGTKSIFITMEKNTVFL